MIDSPPVRVLMADMIRGEFDADIYVDFIGDGHEPAAAEADYLKDGWLQLKSIKDLEAGMGVEGRINFYACTPPVVRAYMWGRVRKDDDSVFELRIKTYRNLAPNTSQVDEMIKGTEGFLSKDAVPGQDIYRFRRGTPVVKAARLAKIEVRDG